MIDIHCDECIWHHKKFPGAIKLYCFAEPELKCCYTSCYTVTLFCVVLLHAVSVLFNLLCVWTFHTVVCEEHFCRRREKKKKKAKPTKKTKTKKQKQNKNLLATDAFPIS